MKILERIREFFRRMKIKKLKAPETPNDEIQISDKNETNGLNYVRNIQSTEITENQKLEVILKIIGCEQVSIKRILENQNIDVKNLRKNIQTLNKLKYSNVELSIIITNNMGVLTMPNDNLNRIINTLIKYYNNAYKVKELVYANSKILSEKGVSKFIKVKDIFSDYGISVIDDCNILIENSNVLFMNEIRLKESLAIIKAYTETIDKLKSLIRMEPLVVGITNTNLLSEYV